MLWLSIASHLPTGPHGRRVVVRVGADSPAARARALSRLNREALRPLSLAPTKPYPPLSTCALSQQRKREAALGVRTRSSPRSIPTAASASTGPSSWTSSEKRPPTQGATERATHLSAATACSNRSVLPLLRAYVRSGAGIAKRSARCQGALVPSTELYLAAQHQIAEVLMEACKQQQRKIELID